ncbi:MAG: bacillithiol biosynthesis deacetylase BshB1 [Candidatus Zixiibacteriota bacterium]|nr:MAG: bacillithiol biosynthesis deacetylase BshB1 [candidate division Zixibacteria bacterium]
MNSITGRYSVVKPAELDILAVAAHPDDIEITCGGLLIKMVKKGYAVGALDLTRGEMGSYGDEDDRDAEADAAARLMGLAYRGNLALKDAGVEVSQENKLKLAAVIRETRPQLVVLPHWEQRHPDHRACHRLGYDACFLSGLKKIDIEGEPHRPRKIIYVTYFRNADYSFLVDISDEFEQKCAAVAAYKSQFDDPETARRIFQPGIDIFEFMRVRARQLGQLAGVQYAEAYTVKEHILIDDPLLMPISSM